MPRHIGGALLDAADNLGRRCRLLPHSGGTAALSALMLPKILMNDIGSHDFDARRSPHLSSRDRPRSVPVAQPKRPAQGGSLCHTDAWYLLNAAGLDTGVGPTMEQARTPTLVVSETIRPRLASGTAICKSARMGINLSWITSGDE